MKIAPIKMKNAFRKIFSGQDRKPRVDKRDLEFVRNWIKDGNNGVTRMDNDSVSILVPDTAGTSASYNKRHTQLMSTPDAHSLFKNSQQYLQWSQRNAREVIDKNGVVKRVLGSIGLELFRFVVVSMHNQCEATRLCKCSNSGVIGSFAWMGLSS